MHIHLKKWIMRICIEKVIYSPIDDIIINMLDIVVVTADSMSNRLASLALGTGGIDCVYHFAFYELVRAVKEVGSEDATETLETLVQGKRLKDISDLPLDLTV